VSKVSVSGLELWRREEKKREVERQTERQCKLGCGWRGEKSLYSKVRKEVLKNGKARPKPRGGLPGCW